MDDQRPLWIADQFSRCATVAGAAHPIAVRALLRVAGVEPPRVPALDLHEVVGEKIRAAAQRSRVRDLYDLYQLASQRFDREVVRRIAVIKCWETRYAFEPVAFLAGLPEAKYDWSDLRRLVRRSWSVTPAEIIRGVQKGYAFLGQLTADEAALAADPYGREKQPYQRLVSSLKRE